MKLKKDKRNKLNMFSWNLSNRGIRPKLKQDKYFFLEICVKVIFMAFLDIEKVKLSCIFKNTYLQK